MSEFFLILPCNKYSKTWRTHGSKIRQQSDDENNKHGVEMYLVRFGFAVHPQLSGAHPFPLVAVVRLRVRVSSASLGGLLLQLVDHCRPGRTNHRVSETGAEKKKQHKRPRHMYCTRERQEKEESEREAS